MVDANRLKPTATENPYAEHPGFLAQRCRLQYTLAAQNAESTYRPGFACFDTGRQCQPGAECDARVASHNERRTTTQPVLSDMRRFPR